MEEGLLLNCVQACSNNGFCIFNVSFQYLANNDALCTTFLSLILFFYISL